MKNKTFALLALSALGTCALAAPAQNGDVTLHFKSTKAYHRDGSPAPLHILKCEKMFKNFRGQALKAHYDINTHNGMQSASLDDNNEHIQLYPMGLTEKYAFISDSPSDKRVNASFEVSKSFQSPKASYLVKTDNPDITCVFEAS